MSLRITKAKIQTWITEGRGSGHGAEYQPWIKITTRKSPSGGNLQYRYIPELGRHSHLLSAGELSLARLLLYLGIEDLREQYPCWPWKHPHPLYQHPHFNPSPTPWSQGTLACANQLQIRHPQYPNTKIPSVPTIDLLATVRAPKNYRAIAFSVKPDPKDVPLDEWEAAKLAIQAAYCKELDIPWKLFSSSQVPETLKSNLEILINYSNPTTVLPAHLDRFTKRILTCLTPDTSLEESLDFVKRTEGLPHTLALNLFHRALWFQCIPIDIRYAWSFSAPPVLTDGYWITQTRQYLLGD